MLIEVVTARGLATTAVKDGVGQIFGHSIEKLGVGFLGDLERVGSTPFHFTEQSLHVLHCDSIVVKYDNRCTNRDSRG